MRFHASRFAIPVLLCSMTVLGWLGGCAAPPDRPAAIPADSAALNAEITEFLARYAAAYNRQDYATLLTFWDRSNPNPIYMAEEIDPPMHGWTKVNAYFARPGVLDGIRNEYTDVNAHYLAPDLAVATYKLRFDIQVKGMKALSSWDRVMAVFRRQDGDWKLTAYTEAPMAPLTMVRRMVRNSSLPEAEQKRLLNEIKAQLEAAVPPDFQAWMQSEAAKPVGTPATRP